MPAWAVRIGIAVADGLGLTDLAKAIGGIVLAVVVFALLAVLGVLLARFALLGGSRGGALVPPALGFWATGLVPQDAAAAGVPAALALAVRDHESGGDWAAAHRNGNGTNDAGLMQVNSENWTAYGLGPDPYAPEANVRAGVAILAIWRPTWRRIQATSAPPWRRTTPGPAEHRSAPPSFAPPPRGGFSTSVMRARSSRMSGPSRRARTWGRRLWRSRPWGRPARWSSSPRSPRSDTHRRWMARGGRPWCRHGP